MNHIFTFYCELLHCIVIILCLPPMLSILPPHASLLLLSHLLPLPPAFARSSSSSSLVFLGLSHKLPLCFRTNSHGFSAASAPPWQTCTYYFSLFLSLQVASQQSSCKWYSLCTSSGSLHIFCFAGLALPPLLFYLSHSPLLLFYSFCILFFSFCFHFSSSALFILSSH